jgi:ELWxxDGT repeat protein
MSHDAKAPRRPDRQRTLLQRHHRRDRRELYQLGRNGIPTLVADINPGPGSSTPSTLTEVNGKLYFTAFTEEAGEELYRLGRNGTPTLVADIYQGPNGSGPLDYTGFNGTLYVTAFRPETGDELYQIAPDGTVALVADINQGVDSSRPNSFFVL